MKGYTSVKLIVLTVSRSMYKRMFVMVRDANSFRKIAGYEIANGHIRSDFSLFFCHRGSNWLIDVNLYHVNSALSPARKEQTR